MIKIHLSYCNSYYYLAFTYRKTKTQKDSFSFLRWKKLCVDSRISSKKRSSRAPILNPFLLLPWYLAKTHLKAEPLAMCQEGYLGWTNESVSNWRDWFGYTSPTIDVDAVQIEESQQWQILELFVKLFKRPQCLFLTEKTNFFNCAGVESGNWKF